MRMEFLEAVGIMVGVIAGVAGLVLGILNYRQQMEAMTPCLRVRPRVMHLIDRTPAIGRDMTEKNVGVMEICNIGQVPVIGGMIWFRARRGRDKGYAIISPRALDGGAWPREIPPGHLVMLRMNLNDLVQPFAEKKVGRACVSTVVGDTFVASRRNMKAFRRSLRELPSPTHECDADH